MRQPIPVCALTVALALSACGSDQTEGDTAVPDETRSPTPATDEPDGTSPDSVPPTATSPRSEPIETTQPATDPTITSSPTLDAPTTDTPASTPERLGLLAATDLAERLGVDIDDIDVVDVEEVTWRDASLGCPQKDFQYAQVLTPGVRIILSAQNATFEYHAGSGRDPFFCVDPQPPA